MRGIEGGGEYQIMSDLTGLPATRDYTNQINECGGTLYSLGRIYRAAGSPQGGSPLEWRVLALPLIAGFAAYMANVMRASTKTVRQIEGVEADIWGTIDRPPGEPAEGWGWQLGDVITLQNIAQIYAEFLDNHHKRMLSEEVTESRTLRMTIQDGLGLVSGFVSPSSYKVTSYFRVPGSWFDGETLLADREQRLFEERFAGLYGGPNWRSGNADGSRFVVLDSRIDVLDEAAILEKPWMAKQQGYKLLGCFHVREGQLVKVNPAEF